MNTKQQLKLDYKLSPPFPQKNGRISTDSRTTFQNFDTPGWSQPMNTQPNADLPPKTQITHNKIMEKLNKMNNIDLTNSKYSRIKIPEDYQGNVFTSMSDINTLPDSRKNRQGGEGHLRSGNKRDKLNSHLQSTSIYSQSRYDARNSLKKSNISVRQQKSGTIVKNKSRISQGEKMKSTQREKRFNHISVHEHLYIDGKRQETKRLMEQIMQQDYKKKNILLFRPIINKKSKQLAQVKFSRMKTRDEVESELIEELKQIQQKQNAQKTIVNIGQLKQSRQQSRFLSVNKLFYFLSTNTEFITKSTVKQVIQQLPLVCIKFIDKIIQKIYQGKQYTWLQFLSAVNDKKTVKNKEGLILIFEKWMSRQLKTKKQNIPHNQQHTTHFCS